MHHFHFTLRHLAAALTFLCVSLPGLAQTDTATLSGVVKDQNGGVIVGTRLTAKHIGTGQMREAVSSPSGDYTITNLPIGSYTLSASFEGFKTTVLQGITLQVGQHANVDITLSLGSVAETVSVTDVIAQLATETSSVGQVVENRSIESLALNGRQFWQLVALVPGATYIPTGRTVLSGGSSIRGSAVNVYVNGSGRARNGWMLDGADITEYERGGTLVQPNVDALQEFRVESANMSAEYGHTPNVISATVKSGTNEFHGNLFEFLRNDKLDARNFFARDKDTLKRNQWGGTIGGPIRRDKTFFFADLESTRMRQGTVFNDILPSVAMRQGDFSELLLGSKPQPIKDPLSGQNFAGNIIPASRISPQARYFLQYMPAPEQAVFNSPTTLDGEKADFKLDQQFGAMDHLMIRYTIGDSRETDPMSYQSLGSAPLTSRGQSIAASWTHIFSPRWLNEARFGYYRSIFWFNQVLPGTDFLKEAGITGFEKTQIAPSFPLISIAGYTQFQGSGFDNRPKSNRLRMWQYNESLSHTVGKHDMKFGGQLYHELQAFIIGGGQEGKFTFSNTYSGNGFGDFMLGYPDNVFRPYFQNLFGNYGNIWSFYWQDNYKATRNLTLNVGLRWEISPFFAGIRGQNSGFDYASQKLIIPMRGGQLLDPTAQPQIPDVFAAFKDRIIGTDQLGLSDSIRPADMRTWAPRLGLAWRPAGSERFVVRGGYGIFFIFLDTDLTLNYFKNPPFQAAQTAYNTRPTPTLTWSNFFQGQPIVAMNPTPGQPCPGGFTALSCSTPDLMTSTAKMRQSYMQQWNFSIQSQLAKNLSLDLAYVANKTTRVAMWIGRNDPLPGAGQIQTRRPMPQWGSMRMGEMIGTGGFQSLQSKLEKRFSRGFQMLAAYTFSKCLDQGEQDGTTIALLGLNRGPCDFNPSQNLVVSSVYELPFGEGRTFLGQIPRAVNAFVGGWEVGAIITAQTGLPFSPTISGDRANTGIAQSQRPNRLGSGTVPNPTPNRWFNVDDFVLPPQYTYGNAGRNILNSDGLKTLDLSLKKQFHLTEARRFELRGEAFNMLNHATFAAPITTINTATAGRVTSTVNPARVMQFALKFYF